MELNQVEKDFIEFMSIKYNRTLKDVESIFIETRKKFKFSGLEFKELTHKIYDLFKIVYDDMREDMVVDSYRFHELLHVFRFISYSYPRPYHNFRDDLRSFFRLLERGDFKKLYKIMIARIFKRSSRGPKRNYLILASFLLDKLGKDYPVVVDYGCGLGYTSFEMGLINKNAIIYLVDIDNLILEFTEYRFKKHGINVRAIRVTKDNLYPKLPQHDICIADEIIEHLAHPLVAYENIVKSLKKGGIIYGNFNDHEVGSFHISPNLENIRNLLSNDFDQVDQMCYRKK